MNLGRLGIVSKSGRSEIPGLIGSTLDWCADQGVDVGLDQNSAEYLGRIGMARCDLVEDCDLVVVFGGDGTLLSAARAVGDRQIPLLAVNLGRLGFMMTTGPDELGAALSSVARSEFELDSRMVLESHLERDGSTIQRHFALNDVVIGNGSVARLVHLEAFVDGEYVCGYRSDGLIISTPTGSTAYSLSAGGPVMAPSVGALTLTPICPHSLSNRSVVLPATSLIEVLVVEGEEGNYLSIDGQVGTGLLPNDRIRVRRAGHCVEIVQVKSLRFFSVLQDRMGWGDL